MSYTRDSLEDYEPAAKLLLQLLRVAWDGSATENHASEDESQCPRGLIGVLICRLGDLRIAANGTPPDMGDYWIKKNKTPKKLKYMFLLPKDLEVEIPL